MTNIINKCQTRDNLTGFSLLHNQVRDSFKVIKNTMPFHTLLVKKTPIKCCQIWLRFFKILTSQNSFWQQRWLFCCFSMCFMRVFLCDHFLGPGERMTLKTLKKDFEKADYGQTLLYVIGIGNLKSGFVQ